MEERPRPPRRRWLDTVVRAVVVLVAGVAAGGQRRTEPRQRVPELQQYRDRATLVVQGWHPATPQRLIKPTYWPFVFGLGIAFLLGGIATSFIVSGVGLFIFALGMVGWIRDLLDEQDSHEGI